uniref:Uncharacterized protein n=1 Tax=Oryza brachyantha TaxID=4533 RepID=J3LK38_ORYBR
MLSQVSKGHQSAGCHGREGKQRRPPGEVNYVCCCAIVVGCSSSIRDPPCRGAERWRHCGQDILAMGLVLKAQSRPDINNPSHGVNTHSV